METLFDIAEKTARTKVTKMRRAFGLHGLASVVFGVMILAWPGISVYALTIVFGAYTLATGIVEFGTAFTSRGREERGWLILRGLLGITVGVLVFAWPGISALALLYVIGAYAVALGILCRRCVVPAPSGQPRHGVDDPDRPRVDCLRDRDLREAGCWRAGRSRTDRGIRARHRSHRARRRNQRRKAARADGEGIRAPAEVAEDDPRAVALTVDLHDRTSLEPATSSPAPRASADLTTVLDRDVRLGAAVVVGKRIRFDEASRPRDVLFIARRAWPLVEAAAGAWPRETPARRRTARPVDGSVE